MKNILKYISIFLIISYCFTYCSSHSNGEKISDKEKIVAVIDKDKISIEDIKKNIEILPEEYKSIYFNIPDHILLLYLLQQPFQWRKNLGQRKNCSCN
ncbi:MAG: hypothetical protein A2W05_09855 [Candidatus Schekmanbacteria bacterium RBG_16_38_10]|uniref:Uncharacterized protein n=1 Tax=Candidatus Schekmanbacteria bacterium RBG_16_38_10 TaxID=1817879 RepID=A0A1F7RME5_9BACT|nr:MAG: hypothetical protein A2W05_09855 [Candidatus Schekmanbacteria bacterium RBG_16_38_10]